MDLLTSEIESPVGYRDIMLTHNVPHLIRSYYQLPVSTLALSIVLQCRPFFSLKYIWSFHTKTKHHLDLARRVLKKNIDI